MANINSPSGFKVVKHATGGLPNRRSRYHIASAYGTNIATNDAVVPTGSGKLIQRPAAATDRLIGIFDGCYYLDPNQSQPQYNRIWPASQTLVSGTVADAWVYDDPRIIFEAQMSGAFTLAGIGSLADIILGTANTTIKLSADAIDSATLDASGVVVKVLDIVNRPDNVMGSFARVWVQISKHYLANALTGI